MPKPESALHWSVALAVSFVDLYLSQEAIDVQGALDDQSALVTSTQVAAFAEAKLDFDRLAHWQERTKTVPNLWQLGKGPIDAL